MSIRVTCPGCHTRFNVSDQFAGKEGPCPKCKKKIKIPDGNEEVVIHAPEHGPTDTQGRPVLKPITREETKLSQVHIALITVSVIGFFALALVMRIMVEDKSDFPQWLLWVAAIVIGPPLAYGSYTLLRDQELGSFLGRELWTRVGICGLVYAALWLAMPLSEYAFAGYEFASWATALGGMIGVGGAVAMLLLDFDYLIGLVHASLYFGVCLLGRLIVGIGVLPGMKLDSGDDADTSAQLLGDALDSLWMLF